MTMSGTSQHLRKRALLVVLVAIVGLGAASALAALSASSTPKPFELVYEAESEEYWAAGSFTSSPPFCESGSAVEVDFGVRRFACADGSGSITLDISFLQPPFSDGSWRILEGTGQYAGLRGKGTVRDWFWIADPLRTTFEGLVAEDAVAPTIGLAAKAFKVKGKKGFYSIPVALDMRDDVEDNPVTYKVIVMRESGAGPWLASKSGEAIGGVSFELRVRRPNAGVKALLIRTTAVDPVGNESSLDARVKLPQ
jgi:hypothetical protein